MSRYPSPGQYADRGMMNGGPNPHPYPHPHPQHQHQPLAPGNHRHNNNNNNINTMTAPSDSDSHYTNLYSDRKASADFNGSNIDKNNKNPKNPKNPKDKMAVHRPRINRKPEDKVAKSSLTTNFDPMKDRHMWAMWRTAVNGRIVDQVRKNEQFKQDALLPPDEFSSVNGENSHPATYGKDLASPPPLSRFIRLNQRSKDIAQELMSEGQGKLETTQFIYYGLPRVAVNTGYHNRYNNHAMGNNHAHQHHHPPTSPAHNGYNDVTDDFNNMNFYNGEGGGPRMQQL